MLILHICPIKQATHQFGNSLKVKVIANKIDQIKPLLPHVTSGKDGYNNDMTTKREKYPAPRRVK
jgi:hypothetical protein